MEKQKLIYSGESENTVYTRALCRSYDVEYQAPETEPTPGSTADANLFVIGEDLAQPVKLLQKVYAIDKYISVIILASPSRYPAVKQSLQFSPFIGKNALVVSLSPETDLEEVCRAAATRTRQKRSFAKMQLHQAVPQQAKERVKITQMGSFLEYAPIGAVLLNAADHILNYNQFARKLFPMLNMVDVDLNNIIPRETAAGLMKFVKGDHDPELKKEIEIQGRQLEVSSSRIFSEEGETHYLLLITDVTDRHAERQRIQSILESLPQMAWTTTPEGEVNYFNQGWYHYTGQRFNDACGMGWTNVIHPEDLDRLRDAWSQSIKTTKPLQQAARYRNHKGDYRWHLTRATAVRNANKETIMWVGTCTDVHDQVLLTEELERKVKERTHSLEVSNNELEQFAHITSHDLQEPLRKIRTFSGILTDTSADMLDEQGRRYLRKINDTAARMSNSLKALLNYTRAHRNDKFTTTDLNQVVANVLLDLELLISQKNATVETSGLPVIQAAPIQMQQLFYNLVNNALKFSREGVPPVITISCREMEESELSRFPALQPFIPHYHIEVSDNGIGFEQQYADKIFTLFQRLHNRSAYEGTGIGLSLVKRVVHNHKGEVYAESEPGNGASFHLLLPQRIPD